MYEKQDRGNVMRAFLITGGTEATRKEKALEICRDDDWLIYSCYKGEGELAVVFSTAHADLNKMTFEKAKELAGSKIFKSRPTVLDNWGVIQLKCVAPSFDSPPPASSVPTAKDLLMTSTKEKIKTSLHPGCTFSYTLYVGIRIDMPVDMPIPEIMDYAEVLRSVGINLKVKPQSKISVMTFPAQFQITDETLESFSAKLAMLPESTHTTAASSIPSPMPHM